LQLIPNRYGNNIFCSDYVCSDWICISCSIDNIKF